MYNAGSNKGMEATAVLEMILSIDKFFASKIYVRHIVSDNDSSMRAKLCHATNNEHDKLPCHIVQPIFWQNPGHRIKSMAKPVFALAKAALAVSTIQMCDAM